MKRLLLITVLAGLCFLKLAGQKEILRVNCFTGVPPIDDIALAQEVTSVLSSFLDEKMSIAEGNIIKIITYTAKVKETNIYYDNEGKKVDTLRWSVADYIIDGKLQHNRITVEITSIRSGETYSVQEEWKFKQGANEKVLKRLADKIIAKTTATPLVDERKGLLLIKNKIRDAIVLLGKDTLTFREGEAAIPVLNDNPRSNNNQPLTVKDKRGTTHDIEYVRVKNYLLTQVKLKVKKNNYVLKKMNNSLGLNLGVNLPSAAPLTAISYHAFLFPNVAFGVKASIARIPNTYLYMTLEGIESLEHKFPDNYWSLGGYGRYERLLPIELLLYAEAGIELVPSLGFFTRLGVTPLQFQWISLEIGSQSQQFSPEQYVFNTFGNASQTPQTTTFNNVYLGVRLNHPF